MPGQAGFWSVVTKVLKHLAAVRMKPQRAEAWILGSCETKLPRGLTNDLIQSICTCCISL